jgi:methyl-accepting chemotaxis protein
MIFIKVRTDTKENIFIQNMDKAIVLSKSLDFFFSKLEEEILLLSKMDAIVNYNFELADPLLQEVIVSNSAISQVYLMDTNGMQYYKTSYLDTIGDRSDRSYFQKSIEGYTYVSEVVISRSTGQPITIISAPIYAEDQIIGVIGATINLDAIADLISAGDKGAMGYSYIVDQNGRIIFHPNNSYVNEMLDISYLKPIQNVMLGENGIGEYVFKGEKKLIAYVSVDKTGWGVAVQVPLLSAYKDIRDISKWFLGMALIGVTSLIGLNILISDFYMRPIQEIVDQINLVKDDRVHIPTWEDRKDEYGLIHHAFIQLMTELNDMHNSLENIVKDRTKALSEVNEELTVSNHSLYEALNKLTHTQDKLIESEKLSALSRISIRIAHELNTPLGNAITTASFLSKKTSKLQSSIESGNLELSDISHFLSEYSKSMTLLEHQIDKSITIVNYINTLPSNYQLQPRKNIQVCKELSATIEALDKQSICPNHRIISHCPEDIVCLAWEGLFKEIFEKLLDNSLKHGCLVERQLLIEIDVAMDDHQLTINYKDNGLGMNPSESEYIFEPLYKGKMSSDSAGMGLTQVYNIVHFIMSGEVVFETAYDKGVNVSIRIPKL